MALNYCTYMSLFVKQLLDALLFKSGAHFGLEKYAFPGHSHGLYLTYRL